MPYQAGSSLFILILCGIVYIGILVMLFGRLLPRRDEARTQEPKTNALSGRASEPHCSACEAVIQKNTALLERVEALLEEISRERRTTTGETASNLPLADTDGLKVIQFPGRQSGSKSKIPEYFADFRQLDDVIPHLMWSSAGERHTSEGRTEAPWAEIANPAGRLNRDRTTD